MSLPMYALHHATWMRHRCNSYRAITNVCLASGLLFWRGCSWFVMVIYCVLPDKHKKLGLEGIIMLGMWKHYHDNTTFFPLLILAPIKYPSLENFWLNLVCSITKLAQKLTKPKSLIGNFCVQICFDPSMTFLTSHYKAHLYKENIPILM